MRALILAGLVGVVNMAGAAELDGLGKSLRFHASFDTSVDADVAKGDPKLYTAASLERAQVQPGLQADEIVWSRDQGRFGGALSFVKKTDKVVFYQGRDNLSYSKSDFHGTISLWMRLSPDDDLPPGYVDPLQITDKKWDDSAFFLDFSDKNPRQFRLGVFSDHAFWNPKGRVWDDIPESERPMVSVAKPPFSRDAWTHVAITFANFNREDSQAVLYMDGRSQGSLSARQRFTWNPERVAILLGIFYIGQVDDLAIFDRALSPQEIAQIKDLPAGIRSLPR